ncbi:Translation Initiation Factor If-3 [Manis pentadactyla]|nr:Translation Initiation Factor If-3 [Manis pentadactyla]
MFPLRTDLSFTIQRSPVKELFKNANENHIPQEECHLTLSQHVPDWMEPKGSKEMEEWRGGKNLPIIENSVQEICKCLCTFIYPSKNIA